MFSENKQDNVQVNGICPMHLYSLQWSSYNWNQWATQQSIQSGQNEKVQFQIIYQQCSSYINNVRCQFPNVGLFLKVIHMLNTFTAYL